MRILFVGRLGDENQRDLITDLASVKEIELFVLTDTVNYVNLDALSQEQIYHYSPLIPSNIAGSVWNPLKHASFRLNPIDMKLTSNLIGEIDPDILLVAGHTDLLFLAPTSGFSPSVFLPQGGETSMMFTPYWDPGPLKRIQISSIYKPIYKNMLNHIDEVWSPELDQRTFEQLGLSDEKFFGFDWYLPNMEHVYPRPDPVEYSRGGKTIFGTFRRIRGSRLQTSFETILNTIDSLSNQRDDFHLVIGGIYESSENETVKYIKEFVSETGLDSYVTLLNMVDKSELPRYYSGLDVYINPIHQNYSMTSIGVASKEAMVCENAFVSLDETTASRSYIIDDGRNGVLVPNKDETTLEAKLTTLIEDEEYRRELAERGRQLIEEMYGNNAVGKRILERCRQLVSSRT